MSTRAMYTFRRNQETVHVYKHHDGYPAGAIAALLAARDFAWQLPRFEPDEFAAAFIAANKREVVTRLMKAAEEVYDKAMIQGKFTRKYTVNVPMRVTLTESDFGKYKSGQGGIRILPTATEPDWLKAAQACADIAYHYEITQEADKPYDLMVRCRSVSLWNEPDITECFHLRLSGFEGWDFRRLQIWEKAQQDVWFPEEETV